jgi:hypothetical protein
MQSISTANQSAIDQSLAGLPASRYLKSRNDRLGSEPAKQRNTLFLRKESILPKMTTTGRT